MTLPSHFELFTTKELGNKYFLAKLWILFYSGEFVFTSFDMDEVSKNAEMMYDNESDFYITSKDVIITEQGPLSKLYKVMMNVYLSDSSQEH